MGWWDNSWLKREGGTFFWETAGGFNLCIRVDDCWWCGSCDYQCLVLLNWLSTSTNDRCSFTFGFDTWKDSSSLQVAFLRPFCEVVELYHILLGPGRWVMLNIYSLSNQSWFSGKGTVNRGMDGFGGPTFPRTHDHSGLAGDMTPIGGVCPYFPYYLLLIYFWIFEVC